MFTKKQLNADIKKAVTEKLDAGHSFEREPLVEAALVGKSSEWIKCAAREFIDMTVKRQTGAANKKNLLQLEFDHLQPAYPVLRDKKRVIVPTEHCTNYELIEHAKMLEKQSEGARVHAEQIKEYVQMRSQ